MKLLALVAVALGIVQVVRYMVDGFDKNKMEIVKILALLNGYFVIANIVLAKNNGWIYGVFALIFAIKLKDRIMDIKKYKAE